MSVSSTAVKIQYTGDGSTTNFSFPFNLLTDLNAGVVISPTDVTIYFGAAGSEVAQSSSTYTVNGPYGSPANTVIFNAAPSNGVLVTIERVKALTQSSRFIDGQPFPASTFELALDKLTMEVQQLQEQLSRVPMLFPATKIANPTIQDFVAGNYLLVDPTGTKLIMSAGSPSATTGLFTNQTVSATNLATISGGNVCVNVTVQASADCVLDLPAATGSGNLVVVTKLDANGHRAAVTPHGTDTINGVNAADYIGVQYGSIGYRDIASGQWVKQ